MPRRYPDVTEEEWAHVADVITLLVHSKVGSALGPPGDIASEAIRRVQEPLAPEWDRANKTLARHVGSFANSLVANGIRKLEFSNTRPLEHADLARAVDPSENPEETYARVQEEAIAAAKFKKVREAVADDACCVALLDAVAARAKRPFERALAAGFTYRQVELAREKIGRAAVHVQAEWARALRKKGYAE